MTAPGPRPAHGRSLGSFREDFLTDLRLTVLSGVRGPQARPASPVLSRSGLRSGENTSMHVSVLVPPSSQGRSQRGGLCWMGRAGVSIRSLSLQEHLDATLASELEFLHYL